jgi:hypothetical protein
MKENWPSNPNSASVQLLKPIIEALGEDDCFGLNMAHPLWLRLKFNLHYKILRGRWLGLWPHEWIDPFMQLMDSWDNELLWGCYKSQLLWGCVIKVSLTRSLKHPDLLFDVLCHLRVLPERLSLDMVHQHWTRTVGQNTPLFFITYWVCDTVVLATETRLRQITYCQDLNRRVFFIQCLPPYPLHSLTFVDL